MAGDLARATVELNAALVAAEEIAALVTQGLCLTYLTQLHRLRGDEESTRAYALRGLNLA
jgi:hypothetical protein